METKIRYENEVLISPTRDDLLGILQMLLPIFGGRVATLNAVYPHDLNDLSNAQIQRMADRMCGLAKADRSVVWCRVRDPATGNLMGASQWHVYDSEETRPKSKENLVSRLLDGAETVDETWNSEKEKDWARAIGGGFLDARWKVLEREALPIVVLDKMAISPEYQRKGVGKTMMAWGVEKTDAMGAYGCVEASMNGKLLYEQFGFTQTAWASFDVPPGFEWTEKTNLQFGPFMERPRKKTSTA